MQPTAAERLAHIEEAIANIQTLSLGETRESFSENIVLRLAVERLFEIISEASRHIPVELKAEEPGINWRRVADLGNWLRHAYHRIDADLLWVMIEDDLEPLKMFVERVIGNQNLD